MERYRVPHSLSVSLMLAAVGGTVALIFMLISSPLLAWMSRLSELGPQLKDKLQMFDGRPGAGVRHWVGKEHRLNLRFSEVAAVNLDTTPAISPT